MHCRARECSRTRYIIYASLIRSGGGLSKQESQLGSPASSITQRLKSDGLRFLSRQPFFKHVASTMSAQIGGLMLSVTASVIVARALGPKGKGAVAVVLLIGNLLALVLNGGLSSANVYFAASGKISPSKLLSNSAIFTFLATVIGTVLVLALAPTGLIEKLVPGISMSLLLVGIIAFPLRLLDMLLSCILQGLQKIVTVNIIDLSQSLIYVVLALLLVVVFKFGIWGAVVALQAGVVATATAKLVFLHRNDIKLHLRWDGAVARETLRFGAKSYVSNIMQFFNYRLDSLIVNFYIGVAGAGLYSVSVSLAELLWHMPNAVSYALFPKSAASKPENVNRVLPRIFGITTAVTTLGAGLLVLSGKFVIQFLFSKAFASAYVPMLALLPGVLCLGGGKVLLAYISGRGYPIYQSICIGISLVVTVVLDFILIPQYGILGAAVASSVSYATILLFAAYFYFQVRQRMPATTEAAKTVC